MKFHKPTAADDSSSCLTKGTNITPIRNQERTNRFFSFNIGFLENFPKTLKDLDFNPEHFGLVSFLDAQIFGIFLILR